MKTKSCRCCSGSGKEIDDAAVGDEMASLRRVCKLSLREVSRRLGFSAPYICDLEQGRRRWRVDLIEKYRKACLKHKP